MGPIFNFKINVNKKFDPLIKQTNLIIWDTLN